MVENRNILISIIIPVYNVEKYIRKCLDSIIGQISDVAYLRNDDGREYLKTLFLKV